MHTQTHTHPTSPHPFPPLPFLIRQLNFGLSEAVLHKEVIVLSDLSDSFFTLIFAAVRLPRQGFWWSWLTLFHQWRRRLPIQPGRRFCCEANRWGLQITVQSKREQISLECTFKVAPWEQLENAASQSNVYKYAIFLYLRWKSCEGLSPFFFSCGKA